MPDLIRHPAYFRPHDSAEQKNRRVDHRIDPDLGGYSDPPYDKLAAGPWGNVSRNVGWIPVFTGMTVLSPGCLVA